MWAETYRTSQLILRDPVTVREVGHTFRCLNAFVAISYHTTSRRLIAPDSGPVIRRGVWLTGAGEQDWMVDPTYGEQYGIDNYPLPRGSVDTGSRSGYT